MLTLYHAPTSVCSQKVRIGFALMDLSYESRMLNLQAGDQFDPDYLKLNPDAVVPTLVDDGLVVVESSLILAYLDRQHFGGRLMPSEAGARVRAEHWLLRCLPIHAAINTLSFSTAMRGKILAEKTSAEIDALAARFPDPMMGKKRKDLILNGLASPYVAQALIYLRRLFTDLQNELEEGPFLNGASPDISDVALSAYVDRLDRLGFSGLWEDTFPRVGAWLEAWKAVPAYAQGITDHLPPGSAEAMKAGGSAHWPELALRWRELADGTH
ncbi:glutathione S-transferase family protein [Roseibium sp. AS2]|uniref:glutathione S-transferase family protein n=1 Tax=Roseibium sp. AS2 TaxID=3135781 RepID=UPI0031722191